VTKHRAEDDPWRNTTIALLVGCVLFALSDIAAAIRQHTDVVLTAVAAAVPPTTEE
jgi:hypothetical protein